MIEVDPTVRRDCMDIKAAMYEAVPIRI